MAPTFASAAAGNNASSARPDPAHAQDWARRTNGATQTFRRSSHAGSQSGSTSAASARDVSGTSTTPLATPGVYVPPHAQAGRNGSGDCRYGKDQMLQLFKEAQDSAGFADGLSSLYVGHWEPNISNGTASASWGRRDDHSAQGQSGVDICWDKDGNILPLSLEDMTEEEKENFTSSVNSPLKPLAQNTNKDGTPKEGLTLRKSSVSHGGAGPYGLASPTTARPGPRRRDTGDAFPFPSSGLASPSTSRFSRDEHNTVTPPPALVRRRTDFKEPNAGVTSEERDKEKADAENAGPFGTLKRTTTAPFSSTSNASPWSATSPAAYNSPMGAFGSFQAEKKPGFGSLRGESRFKGLMGKASSEDLDKVAREKPSLSSLTKVSEAEAPKQSSSWMEARSNRPMSNDTDPFPDDDLRTGSAALAGGDDLSPPRQQGFGSFATPHRPDPRDEPGVSAFGMTSDTTGLRDIFHGRDNFPNQTPQRGEHEPMSPTDTNPYQSPDHDRHADDDADTDGSDGQSNYPGMGSFQVEPSSGPNLHAFGGLGNLGRVSAPFEIAASDRSQTSSTGPNRGFPTLPGLGNLPGLGGSAAWASGPQTIGTPVRERGHGFDGMFGTVGELQSPGLGGLGGGSMFGAGGGLSGSGTIGRSSKLGSLFPTAMQDQMRNEQHRPSVDEGSAEGERTQSMTGTFGRGAFGSQAPGGAISARETDSPFRSGRGLFDDFPGSTRPGEAGMSDPIGAAFGQLHSSGAAPSASHAATTQAGLGQNRISLPTATQAPPSVSSPASSQPPAPQQRTMVMPDRMRWIYRDPQGNIQGPFSGLEMHDWYKAGFFSPELLVKKYEDPDYEPLAQLIRRIGNSREPFLVPQIGIPHGPPTTQGGNAWAGATAGAQPPFANSFPSFGTTLTADQQNALERRKQEEQYLMARQKEHLAQQQMVAKQSQIIGPGILPGQLQHHSSAHSLHSQPSFGSITSPSGYQPSPTQGPVQGGQPLPGLLDNNFRPAPVPGLGSIGPGMEMLGNIREEDVPGMMDRLNLGRTGQQSFGSGPLPPFGQQQAAESNTHAQQVVAMLNDRARLQREQVEHDNMSHLDSHEQQAAQASAERLQQFHDLRLQTDLDQSAAAPPPEGVIGRATGPAVPHQHGEEELISPESPVPAHHPAYDAEPAAPAKSEPLSLTEQVQKAASAKHSPAPQSPWAKVEPAIHPFPPPPSQSPLPAPSAQRKHNVADSLAADARSRSQTPSADTPSASIAPWAKEPAEAPKGPSLKEIQEAEARTAAQKEEAAAAARRLAAQQELLAQAQSPAAQPGLPSSSTWASGASPATPSSAASPSVWAKPAAGKATGPPTAAGKKTLQQIVKEEEARKQRQLNAAAANAVSTLGAASPGLSSGKRYADLAGKHTPVQPTAPSSSAWTTVGASGKVKGASTPAPAVPAAVRSTSSSVIPPVAKKPTSRSATGSSQVAGKANAEEEFRKWAVGELRPWLHKSINADDFVASLLSFPADAELLTESVHSASETINARHFTEEFLRRRKLADKGVVVDSSSVATSADAKAGGGGWSEVAKKGGQPTQPQQTALDSGNFKVVAPKKKGGKR